LPLAAPFTKKQPFREPERAAGRPAGRTNLLSRRPNCRVDVGNLAPDLLPKKLNPRTDPCA
jgi:hypothetical protein